MKTLFLSLLTLTFVGVANAEQTPAEKGEATVNDAKRAAKKTVHKVEEKICAEGDAKCLAEKAKHRGTEGKDYVKDKAKETKDKLD